jgi:hypothetical protein
MEVLCIAHHYMTRLQGLVITGLAHQWGGQIGEEVFITCAPIGCEMYRAVFGGRHRLHRVRVPARPQLPALCRQGAPAHAPTGSSTACPYRDQFFALCRYSRQTLINWSLNYYFRLNCVWGYISSQLRFVSIAYGVAASSSQASGTLCSPFPWRSLNLARPFAW